MYYTPQRLSVIYCTADENCPCCRGGIGNYIHMVWECPLIQTFWQAVAANISSISGIPIKLDPLILLLGVTDNIPTNTHTKIFIFYCAYYARKTILINWKAPEPPRISAWKTMVNVTLPLYKLTYMGRNCPKKFQKIWSAWVEARHLTV